MANTTLKKITADAKRIRKANPKIAWSAAIKKAGALYRQKKLSGMRTRKKAKKAPAFKVRTTRNIISGLKKSKIVKTKVTTLGNIPGGKDTRIAFLYSEIVRFENMYAVLKKKQQETTGKAAKNSIAKVRQYYSRLIRQAKTNIELLKKLK